MRPPAFPPAPATQRAAINLNPHPQPTPAALKSHRLSCRFNATEVGAGGGIMHMKSVVGTPY